MPEDTNLVNNKRLDKREFLCAARANMKILAPKSMFY